MKELTREVKTVETYGYEAMDGTRFNEKEECIKYENTAECVIKSRLPKSKYNGTEYEMFDGLGCDEYIMDTIELKTDEDIKNLSMYANFYNMEISGNKKIADLKIGDIVTIGSYTWEDDKYIWNGLGGIYNLECWVDCYKNDFPNEVKKVLYELIARVEKAEEKAVEEAK